MTWTEITSLTSAIFAGIAAFGWIGNFLLERQKHRLSKAQKTNDRVLQDKEKRYKAILNLMYPALDFDSNTWVQDRRPELKELKDLLSYLNQELPNIMLIAGDDVILQFKEFLKNPVKENFWKTVLVMRKDLFGIETKLSIGEFLEKA